MQTGAEARRGGLRGFRLPGLVRRGRGAEEEQARAIQSRLLPGSTPQLDGFDIACAWQPSAEVSGDYVDVFDIGPGRIGVCIADVSGKGLDAVMMTGRLQAAVREFGPNAGSPAELCTLVNQALCGPGMQTRYATMFFGVLERGDRRLRYESAGHCLPLLVRGNGGVEFPASFSGVIGIFSHWLYQNQEVELRSGDCLVLVTDGILAAENRRREEFGYQRLIATVESARGLGAAETSQKILAAVTKFRGGKLQDEASLIVVRVG